MSEAMSACIRCCKILEPVKFHFTVYRVIYNRCTAISPMRIYSTISFQEVDDFKRSVVLGVDMGEAGADTTLFLRKTKLYLDIF